MLLFPDMSKYLILAEGTQMAVLRSRLSPGNSLDFVPLAAVDLPTECFNCSQHDQPHHHLQSKDRDYLIVRILTPDSNAYPNIS